MQLYQVFLLGNFKGGHFHLISDENKLLSNIPHSHNVKGGPTLALARDHLM